MERAKNTIILALFIIGISLFMACGEEKSKTEKILEVASERLVYDILKTDAYTVDENGNLYTMTHESIYDEEGIILDKNFILSVYDLEANLIEQYTLDKSLDMVLDYGIVRKMTIRDGKLYSVFDNKGVLELYSYDLVKKTDEKLCTFEGYTKIENLISIDEKVYFIGIDENELGKEYNGTDKAEHYIYNGEVFGYIDINEKVLKQVSVEFPISISATFNDSIIMVYAYDDNEGYYFAEYNTDSEKIEVIQYSDYGNDLLFTIVDKEKRFVYLSKKLGLVCASMDADAGQAIVVSDCAGSDILYVGGQVFYINDERMLSRISLEDNIKWNQPIKAIYSEYIVTEPFGCGYTIKTDTLDSEAFALKVLAQDKDFDACLLDSSKDVAANIKKNGIFYPLNEVEGVMGYLDACFPYVKEAALTDKGEVWMIPVCIEQEFFVYDKNVFEEYGITTDMVADFDGFTEVTDRFAQETDLRMNVWYAALKYRAVDQYLSKYISADTLLFREMSEILFNRCCKDTGGYIDSNLSRDWHLGRVDSFLYFQSSMPMNILSEFGETTDYGIILFPGIEDGIKNQVTCIMMSVNPDSENLENTLNYISEYAKYMLEQRNSFLLSDISTYDDTAICRELYNCYADGEITFRIDSDILLNSLNAYLDGEITLEECIEESDRKLKVYLNE